MRWLLIAALFLSGCHLKIEGRKTSCSCVPPAINDNPQDQPEKQCARINDEESKKICIEAVGKAEAKQ